MSGSGLDIRSAAHGSIPPERMRALVMTAPWSVDDTKPTVDAAFQNKIPAKHKKDGVFHLGIGMEGLLVDSKGEWGRAIFSRDREFFPVMVPMNRVRIGATWRSLPDKLREAESIDPNPNQGLPYTTHPVYNYINRLWESFRQQTERFQSLGLSDYKLRQTFGANFAKNVSLISEGFTPQVKQIMSDGTFTLANIATLPQVTPQWPAPGSRLIYIILYLRQDGGVGVGLYVGQAIRHAWQRFSQHRLSVDDNSPHYNVAHKSRPEDRLMIPIIVWDPDQVVPTEVVDMAEQTLMALFDSYTRWARSDSYRDDNPVGHSQVAFIREVSASIRLTCHLPSYNITGTNTLSPIFDLARLMPFDCYRSSAKATGQRGMTTYRQARNVPSPADSRPYRFNINCITPDGTKHDIGLILPPEVGRVNTRLYLVFEIMHDGSPHEVPYLGCPTVGPFENFSIASSLGIALEWYDESANGWKRSYLNSKAYRGDFQVGLRASDTMKSIAPWRRCMNIIQLLEGINYTGPLNGFYQSIHFISADVKELVVDHLNQKVSWRPRPRQNRPAPKLALFEDNAYLLKSLLHNTKTLTNMTNPPTADFWAPNALDANIYNRRGTFHWCDFCRYMQTDIRFPCERDPRFTDRWVCRCCAVMHRPCTWTARSHALEYWGSGAPYLTKKSQYSLCPTGPRRLLSFHRTFTGSTKTIDIDEPIKGLQGLNALPRVSVDLGDEEELDGDENVSRDGSEDED
ncbi:hypothetical protein ACHAPZ_007569 [Fusarium culmorum]